MSKPGSPLNGSTTISSLDTTPMHSSIDHKALSAESLSVPKEQRIDDFESVNQIFEQLRRRIGRLYGTTDYDHKLSRLGLILITLESCVARLNQGEQALKHTPSFVAIILEIDKCCQMIERESKNKNEDLKSIWAPLIRLLEKNEGIKTKPHGDLEQRLSSLEQRGKDALVGEQTLSHLIDQVVMLRDLQLSDHRKLFASLSALHATIERCVDRLSRVEYGLMEARSIETSSAIADWPQSMQSVNLSHSEDSEPPPITIDPRRALAAARGATRSPLDTAERKKIQ